MHVFEVTVGSGVIKATFLVKDAKNPCAPEQKRIIRALDAKRRTLEAEYMTLSTEQPVKQAAKIRVLERQIADLKTLILNILDGNVREYSIMECRRKVF